MCEMAWWWFEWQSHHTPFTHKRKWYWLPPQSTFHTSGISLYMEKRRAHYGRSFFPSGIALLSKLPPWSCIEVDMSVWCVYMYCVYMGWEIWGMNVICLFICMYMVWLLNNETAQSRSTQSGDKTAVNVLENAWVTGWRKLDKESPSSRPIVFFDMA